MPSRPSASKAVPGLVVALDGSAARLIDERRGRAREQQEAPGLDAWDALTAIARTRRLESVRVRVPFASCFERRVELPEAARGDIDRILALELERTTPFRLKDVYTAHLVDEARTSNGLIGVSQLIIQRDTVDPALAELRALGMQVSGVDCWSEDGTRALPVDFLPRDPARQGEGGASRLPAWLAVLALALSGTALYSASSRYEAALASLKVETEAARAKAQSSRQALDTSEAARRDVEAMTKIKAARVPAVEILDTLTRLIPDTAWVSDYRIEGDRLEFSGEAESAAPLVSIIENSELFSDASFTAPVTREDRRGRERFSLSATIGKSAAVKPDTPAEPAGEQP